MYLNNNKGEIGEKCEETGENKDCVKLKDIKEDFRENDIPKLSMKYIKLSIFSNCEFL